VQNEAGGILGRLRINHAERTLDRARRQNNFAWTAEELHRRVNAAAGGALGDRQNFTLEQVNARSRCFAADRGHPRRGAAQCRGLNRYWSAWKGESRLSIKEDRSKLNYCLSCDKAFFGKGLERLGEMQAEVEKLLSNRAASSDEPSSHR
jgi:hypothetical protein